MMWGVSNELLSSLTTGGDEVGARCILHVWLACCCYVSHYKVWCGCICIGIILVVLLVTHGIIWWDD